MQRDARPLPPIASVCRCMCTCTPARSRSVGMAMGGGAWSSVLPTAASVGSATSARFARRSSARGKNWSPRSRPPSVWCALSTNRGSRCLPRARRSASRTTRAMRGSICWSPTSRSAAPVLRRRPATFGCTCPVGRSRREDGLARPSLWPRPRAVRATQMSSQRPSPQPNAFFDRLPGALFGCAGESARPPRQPVLPVRGIAMQMQNCVYAHLVAADGEVDAVRETLE